MIVLFQTFKVGIPSYKVGIPTLKSGSRLYNLCKVRGLKLLELKTDRCLLHAANLAVSLARTDQAACCALTVFARYFAIVS